jgi:membrane fusion protein, copper/silver efflux system
VKQEIVMKKQPHSWNRIRSLAIVLTIVIFVGGGGWLYEKFGLQHSSAMPEGSDSGPHNMQEMAGMEMDTQQRPTDLRSSQASAMVSPLRQQMIGVQTAVVEKRRLSTTVRAVSRVTYNEERMTHVNLRISGWIENLYVDSTGQSVKKGQRLFTLYSPELVATQEEYVLALQALDDIQDSPLPDIHHQAQLVLEAARDRLRLWTFTDDQIEELEYRGTPTTSVTIYSPRSGFIIDKTAFQGMFVKPEMTLYTIADLSAIWVTAEVHEYELPFIREGQLANLSLEALPGEILSGRVTYIYPYLNKQSRTAQVRLEFSNPQIRLKPDMYGTIVLEVERGPNLAIPEQAVLDSGLRQMVYVAQENGVFEPREVTLGAKVGSLFEVTNGVKEGERIVTSGTFLLDSESRLMATSNMMGALGMGGVKMEQAQMGKMDMGGMKMDGMKMDMNMKGMEMAATQKSAAKRMEQSVGGLTLIFLTDPTPARSGENRILVIVTDKSGKPVSDAKVRLTFTMPMPGMVPDTVPMNLGKQGTYEAKVNLGMAGQWDLTMTIKRPEQKEVHATFSVVAGSRGMSGMPGM